MNHAALAWRSIQDEAFGLGAAAGAAPRTSATSRETSGPDAISGGTLPVAGRAVSYRTPARWSVVVMLSLGCGGSCGGDDTGSGSSGGCGSSGDTGRCEIVSEGTACGDRITVECFDGGEPEAGSQCEKALEESDESIYCCTSAVDEASAVTGAAGGGASASTTTTTAASATSTTGTGGDGGPTGEGGAGGEIGEGGEGGDGGAGNAA